MVFPTGLLLLLNLLYYCFQIVRSLGSLIMYLIHVASMKYFTAVIVSIVDKQLNDNFNAKDELYVTLFLYML